MNMKRNAIFVTGLLTVLGLGLSACKREAPQLPLGALSGTGTLVRAEVSLLRRGSHLLVKHGKKQFYIESRTQNLQEFEGQTVYVEGILQKNSGNESLPVLEASMVKTAHGNDDAKLWEIPTMNIRIETPVSWKPTIAGAEAAFFLENEQTPIMVVRRISEPTLPPGEAFYIANRRATRRSGDGQAESVTILDGKNVLELSFDPASQNQIVSPEDAQILLAQFEYMISSMAFLSDAVETVKSTGSGSAIPCGGSAGILCPQGSFCNIFDTENRIGHCKAL